MTAVTIVRLLLHKPLLPIQLDAARKHRDIIGAHNVNEHPFKVRTEDNWSLHWPKGLVIVGADETKDPAPYAHAVLSVALGDQLVPEIDTVTIGSPAWKPDWAVAPGETIRETLDQLGVTPERLAERSGLPATHVHRLLEGREVVDAATAVRLEHALGITAEFWIRMDAAYQIHHARKNHDERGCACRSLVAADTERPTS